MSEGKPSGADQSTSNGGGGGVNGGGGEGGGGGGGGNWDGGETGMEPSNGDLIIVQNGNYVIVAYIV